MCSSIIVATRLLSKPGNQCGSVARDWLCVHLSMKISHLSQRACIKRLLSVTTRLLCCHQPCNFLCIPQRSSLVHSIAPVRRRDCTGWKILQLEEPQNRFTADRGAQASARFRCRTLRGNLGPRSVRGVGATCVGSAQRDPLPGGSWNWGTTSVSGGSWFSTPAAGQCVGTYRPGDGSGCTWRIRGRPTFIESTCVNNKLDEAIVNSKPACFKDDDLAAMVNRSSECFYRCLRRASHSGTASADALRSDIIRPTFLHAWPNGGNVTGQCATVLV